MGKRQGNKTPEAPAPEAPKTLLEKVGEGLDNLLHPKPPEPEAPKDEGKPPEPEADEKTKKAPRAEKSRMGEHKKFQKFNK